jgi:uncharacterized protein
MRLSGNTLALMICLPILVGASLILFLLRPLRTLPNTEMFEQCSWLLHYAGALQEISVRQESFRSPNLNEALKWCRKAAVEGNAEAQLIMGQFYIIERRGHKRDAKEAAIWWQQAANQGNSTALHALGRLYDAGNGVPQDHMMARNLYLQSAAHGNKAQAPYYLGESYSSSYGTGPDYIEAFNWYKKSAEANYLPAQLKLGQFYAEGQGIKQDWAESYFWYAVVAKISRSAAKQGKNQAAAHLLAEQISRLQKQAENWKPTRH